MAYETIHIKLDIAGEITYANEAAAPQNNISKPR